MLPVPAPATAMLLADVPTFGGPVMSELTTPTGAALLHGLAVGFGPMPPMVTDHVGFGAGTRDIGLPNICQLTVGDSSEATGSADPLEPVALLETNIDHLPAEELAFAAEELLGEGALDVWQTPIVMKKGRSAVMLSVLAPAGAADALRRAHHRADGHARACAASCWSARSRSARASVVDSPWGPARVKVGAGRIRPEHDDVARIAREHGLPYRVVAAEIERLARKDTAPE